MLVLVAWRFVVPCDQPHHSRRSAFDLRLRCAATRVVEVEGEGRLTTCEPLPQAGREAREQDTGDPVPELRTRRLAAVVQQPREDQLLVRTELAQERRDALGVPRVAFASDDEADRLLDALSHLSPEETWRGPAPGRRRARSGSAEREAG